MSSGAVVWIVIGVAALGFVGLVIQQSFKTPEERQAVIDRHEANRAARNSKQLNSGATVRRNISEVGNQTHVGLQCPRCGGMQFKARRSKAARAGVAVSTIAFPPLGAAAVAATKKKRVQCVTCGTVYDRG